MLSFIVYLSALFTAETQAMSVRTEAGLGAWRQAASHFLENLFSELIPGPSPSVSPADSLEMLVLSPEP